MRVSHYQAVSISNGDGPREVFGSGPKRGQFTAKSPGSSAATKGGFCLAQPDNQSSAMSQTEIQGSDIAVIGLAGRFPKASNIETFWQNLRNGVEAISFFSDDELKHSGAKLDLNNPNFVKA